MPAQILKLQRSGTPQTLLENATEIADDMQFVAMVFVTKDGTIRTEWSELDNNLTAVGAVEILKRNLILA